MENIVLKQSIVDEIKKDGLLYGKVSVALDVLPVSLATILRVNSSKLTQISVLRILSEHLNIENQDDLLETISESDNNNNTPSQAN